MRLEIDFKAILNQSVNGTYVHHFIALEPSVLLKYVSYVVIDGKKYDRPIGDSKEIQNYYYFIIKNKMKMTELMMTDGKHYFLKDGKFQSYDTYCFYDPRIKIMYYAIDGEILTPEKERLFVLKKKLNKLIKKSI